MNECSLCKELKSGDSRQFPEIKKYFEISRIFAYNDELCIFPTVGCFIRGYILLSTVEHYLSLYNCPDEIVNGIDKAVHTIKRAFEEKLQSRTVFFEHGTVNDCGLSSASVSHSHMHFLPINEPIWESVNSKYGFSYHKVDALTDLKRIISDNGITSYLLFGDYDGAIYLIDCTSKQYPSQFFRKVMYDHYFGDSPNNEWDWKLFPFYDLMADTVAALDGIKI